MTSAIVKPCHYDIEKLTVNRLMNSKKKQPKQFYYPPTMEPEAP